MKKRSILLAAVLALMLAACSAPGFQHPRFPCTGFCPGILQRILLRGLRTCILR